MKKIFLFILTFFFSITSASAVGKVYSIDINVNIDDDGTAIFQEKWVIEKQDSKIFTKSFYDVDEIDIADITLTDENEKKYDYQEVVDENSLNSYHFNNGDKEKSIDFTSPKKDNTVIINYKIEKFITEFKDTQGINWYFIPLNTNLDYDVVNIHIKGSKSFDESNTALYVIGNNIFTEMSNGEITILASNLNNKTEVHLLTSFTDLKYSNPKKINKTFDSVYKSSINDGLFSNEVIKKIFKIIFVILISIIILAIVIGIIIKRISSKNKEREYRHIEAINHFTLPSIDEVDYNDATPCDGDLYKIAFLADYFKLLKNKTDLIGAILLKWIYDGYLKIIYDEKPYLTIKKNLEFNNDLDNELYNILVSSSKNNKIDESRLIRYSKENYMQVMNYYNSSVNTTINNMQKNDEIKLVKKLFGANLVLQKEAIEDIKKIQGLKKYLLNFNQVPRQTELTKEGYKYLLILSELLGIGEQVSQEILRKNPDNQMANILYDFQSIKYLYKDIYAVALIPYKEVKKKKKEIKD